MSRTIRWSPTAQRTYFRIIEYLLEKWTKKEAEAFILRVEKVLEYIQGNPFLYPYSKASDTFKSVIVKQVSLFYRLRACLNFDFVGENQQFLVLPKLILSRIAALLCEK